MRDADKIQLLKAAIALWEDTAEDIEKTIPYGLLPIWELIEQEQRSIKAKATETEEKHISGANKYENVLSMLPKRKEEVKEKEVSSGSSPPSVDFSVTNHDNQYRELAETELNVFTDPIDYALAVTGRGGFHAIQGTVIERIYVQP